MRMAAKTWTGEWWLHGGGGNAWHGFTYDAELDQLYIGTGNGSPWNRKIRSPEGGDNLFLCSIVALNPDTGEYKWHYQTTPGETWDFNSNMDIVLADLPIEGRPRKVILHAPKNGFFYVIDRTTGKLISAEPFTKTTWASRIDKETGRPIEIEGARYERGVATVAPTPIGAHSWHAMSFNPKTGLAYYPAMHLNATFNDKGFDPKTWRATPWSVGYGVGGQFISGASRPGTSLSSLQAWDPVQQRLAWEVPMDGVFHPGTLTTAGNLVFQGRVDGSLRAYTADAGIEVWRRDLGLGISAPPITYAVNGKQYVAILVGWGGAMAGLGGSLSAANGWAYGVHTRYLVAFSLDGKAALPVQPPPTFATPLKADFTVDPAQAQVGAELYARCIACHGPAALASGMAPDLRASFVVTSAEQFARVLRGGARAARGMPDVRGHYRPGVDGAATLHQAGSGGWHSGPSPDIERPPGSPHCGRRGSTIENPASKRSSTSKSSVAADRSPVDLSPPPASPPSASVCRPSTMPSNVSRDRVTEAPAFAARAPATYVSAPLRSVTATCSARPVNVQFTTTSRDQARGPLTCVPSTSNTSVARIARTISGSSGWRLEARLGASGPCRSSCAPSR